MSELPEHQIYGDEEESSEVEESSSESTYSGEPHERQQKSQPIPDRNFEDNRDR